MESASRNFDYNNNERIFCRTFEELARLDHGIVKTRTRAVTSIILFEAVSVGAAEAIKEQDQINLDGFYQWVMNRDFNNLITGATNTKNRVNSRIEYCKNKFLEENV